MPTLGRYRIRSAITNPAGKNRLDAGMNGMNVNANPCNVNCFHRKCDDERLSDEQSI